MTQTYVDRSDLKVAAELAAFIETEVMDTLDLNAATFWAGASAIFHDLGAVNRTLLAKREDIQTQLDDWHRARRDQPHDGVGYKAYLEAIGYLMPEGGDFQIETENVDPEIASIAGPQLVVPVTNARFVLNAANARWGSLYDGFYGTDAMGPAPSAGGYDTGRGGRVVSRTAVFLDEAFPVRDVSHGSATAYAVVDGALRVDGSPLINPEKFAGYSGDAARPDTVLLSNNNLHVELVFARDHPIGKTSPSGLADVVMESAFRPSWIARIPWPVSTPRTRCSPIATGWA